MGERRANISPRYAARLENLRRYHIVHAKCLPSGRQSRKRLWELGFGSLPPSTFLQDIEARLRCMRCGRRGESVLLVMVSEDD